MLERQGKLPSSTVSKKDNGGLFARRDITNSKMEGKIHLGVQLALSDLQCN